MDIEEQTMLLAYCGFYCGDCLGYTGVIADAAQTFSEVLEQYGFDRTAECVFPEQLGDYGRLREILAFMADLRCPGVCRQGEGQPSSCEVKNCCRERGFFACYECDEFESCEKLASLHGGLHTESSVKNMRAIRELGLEKWLVAGQRHCYWDDL
jgi:hypothetical protein